MRHCHENACCKMEALERLGEDMDWDVEELCEGVAGGWRDDALENPMKSRVA